MGAQLSASAKLGQNEFLRRFTGLEPISDNDPFWNQMLSFNFKAPTNRVDAKFLHESVNDLFEALMYNTSTTGNFAAFVRVFLRRAMELKTSAQCEDKIFLWQTANALLIMRYCCQFFAQRLSEEELKRVFSKNVMHSDGKVEVKEEYEEAFESTIEELLNALVEIVVDLPLNEATLKTQLEALDCALALLSGEIFGDKPKHSKLLLLLMNGRCSIHAPLLTKTLLTNYVFHDQGQYSGQTAGAFEGGGSVVLSVAASLWNVLQWGYNTSAGVSGDSAESVLTLGSQSLLLLMILVSHHSQRGVLNPYRQALFSCYNSQEVATLTNPTQAVATFKFDYSKLYDKICAETDGQATVLLLYFLLHQNSAFKNYVLSRVNIDGLLLPVLKILHKSTTPIEPGGTTPLQTDSHRIWLALIVILILSEDDFFCKVVHETHVKRVDWYTERSNLSDLTLGGFAILVLIRAIQHNVVKVRDRYLQTNCLAALANMSPYFKQLHQLVCQRLVGLLEILCKRHSRFIEQIRLSAEYGLAHTQNSVHMQDIGVLEEGMRMVMEILNCSLTHNLQYNPHLIYTMLYKRDLFDGFQNHPMFQDLIWNICVVLNHFAAGVNSLDKAASVNEVLDVIRSRALQWQPDRLKKFPELKFKYVEDKNTDDFFVPYVWSIIYVEAGFYWEPIRVKLFNPPALTVTSFGDKSPSR